MTIILMRWIILQSFVVFATSLTPNYDLQKLLDNAVKIENSIDSSDKYDSMDDGLYGDDDDSNNSNATEETSKVIFVDARTTTCAIELPATTASDIRTTSSSIEYKTQIFIDYAIQFDEVRNVEDIYSELWINGELIKTRGDIGVFFGKWTFFYEPVIDKKEKYDVVLKTRNYGTYRFSIGNDEYKVIYKE